MSEPRPTTPRRLQSGFIDARDMLFLYIFLIVVGVVGGIGIWELLKWLYRHLSWSWS